MTNVCLGNVSICFKNAQLPPPIYVNVSMRTMRSLQKLTNIKKDARLTIRIPKELKDKIDGIDQLYGVALPKIANECLKAFCEYVEKKKQTPTFPLSIGPLLLGGKMQDGASVRRQQPIHRSKRQQA